MVIIETHRTTSILTIITRIEVHIVKKHVNNVKKEQFCSQIKITTSTFSANNEFGLRTSVDNSPTSQN